MKLNKIRDFLPSLMLFLIMVMASAYFWRMLPKKEVAWVIPGIYLFVLLTLPPMLKLSPKALHLSSIHGLIARTLTAVGLLFGSIHIGMLLNAVEPGKHSPALFISFGLGLFMIALGLTLEKIERNFLIGFRTPWSMASEANWKATHRFGAKVMIVTGFLVLLMSVFAAPSLVASISSLIFAAVIPVFYSLWYFQNVEKPELQK